MECDQHFLHQIIDLLGRHPPAEIAFEPHPGLAQQHIGRRPVACLHRGHQPGEGRLVGKHSDGLCSVRHGHRAYLSSGPFKRRCRAASSVFSRRPPVWLHLAANSVLPPLCESLDLGRARFSLAGNRGAMMLTDSAAELRSDAPSLFLRLVKWLIARRPPVFPHDRERLPPPHARPPAAPPTRRCRNGSAAASWSRNARCRARRW